MLSLNVRSAEMPTRDGGALTSLKIGSEAVLDQVDFSMHLFEFDREYAMDVCSFFI